ncbi:MAG: hypothetical protein HMLKMBBP_01792 [Planctomycetes bacterium]|nr:hypothetical protein [Planctomycetota bacterium]
MKRVHLFVGLAAAALAGGCVTGPARGLSPTGNADPHRDMVTTEQYPLQSSSWKDEVDRRFEQQYPGTMNWLYVWGRDRWFDLMDVASWDLSFGRGFGFNAHLTEFAQVGLNWWDGTSWGQRGRAWGTWATDETDRGVGPFYWVEFERTPQWGTKTLFTHTYKYTGWDLQEAGISKITHDDWSDLGATAHLFAVGAHLSASPVEAVDFVVGAIPVGLIANVAGYHHPIFDIMGDDTWSEIEKDLATEHGR